MGSTDFLYSNEHLIEISMLKNLKVSEIIEEKLNVVGVVVSTSDNFLYFQYFKKIERERIAGPTWRVCYVFHTILPHMYGSITAVLGMCPAILTLDVH